MAHQTFDKPAPGSGRLERRKRKLQAKANIAIESHADMLARVEFWRVLREQLFIRDGGKCRACQKPLDANGGLGNDALHAHHVVFKSAGGRDELSNLACLCSVCHRLCHDGRLSIFGTVEALQFTMRDLKGTIKRAWESVLHG